MKCDCGAELKHEGDPRSGMEDNVQGRVITGYVSILTVPLYSVCSSEPIPYAFKFKSTGSKAWPSTHRSRNAKTAFLDGLVTNLTVPELAMQLHLMFADAIVGPKSDNSLWDETMHLAPTAAVGIMQDWYPTNKTQYNSVQKLNLEKARVNIPIMQFGECLHGVGSYKQSMFPQAIGMAASFDTDLVYSVGRAIASEARSIGVTACLSPVLDIGKELRWGRLQEAWGEDVVLTSKMGVAYASGLSKNGTWSDPDAVVPVMKHFAAYGGSQGGINGAPYMGHGVRELLQELLVPFKAAIDLGGVRGVMMAYSEFDDIPAHIHPLLYQALDDWGFDGFVTADDTGMVMLQSRYKVSSSPADTMQQWFNAGGGIQYYDYPLDIFINTIVDLVANGSIQESTLRSHVCKILGVKYDLGLFDDPYISEDIDTQALTDAHVPLTLDAAHRSIVLLENRNMTLPLKPIEQNIKTIALIGPFIDTLNYGDYSGQFGAYPTANSYTIRQAMTEYLAENASKVKLLSSWGSNTWLYNGQYNIPGYLLSTPNGTAGGLLATYYADTNFSKPAFQIIETPNRDWGLYPPNGLPSNNFSAIWEGNLSVPVNDKVEGWIGVAVYANNSAKLYIDDELVAQSAFSSSGNILSNIESLSYSEENSTMAPPGSVAFNFTEGSTHKVRVEFQAWNLYQKIENVNSLNAEIELFWNLVDRVDPVGKAVNTAMAADIIVLAVGANWNSDGEGGDRATLGLSANQTELADAIFALGKPVVMVLQGGRPFAIPKYYEKSAAVLNAYFPGQSGGRAISDVLFGKFNPGARIPLSVPYSVGQLPVYYNYKYTARANVYTDLYPYPSYPFGYGLSYTTFSLTGFHVISTGGVDTFASGDSILFAVTITNNGSISGSNVLQVYLLQRVSSISRAAKQLVGFKRVYLEAQQSLNVTIDLEVDRYLSILSRGYEWVVEPGEYTFALMENSGYDSSTDVNVTLTCIG
ncbi:MAG: hypothetical protein M1834_006503 [Cirrosporium novae-zelandiae]|nr:MAG: hypothetical protein M1834_006503 [Cirrosporium novae-zelandiae]